MPVSAAVLSFEGGVVRANGVRAAILATALQAQGLDLAAEPWRPAVERALTGRTFDEVVARCLRAHPVVRRDPTLLELIALDAHRRYAAWLRDGAALVEPVDTRLQLLGPGPQGGAARRLVLRADARRRDVAPFLEQWGLHDRFAMIRCADDPPVAGSRARSSWRRSWDAIVDRLTRWGVAPASVVVIGPDARGEAVARRLLAGIRSPEV